MAITILERDQAGQVQKTYLRGNNKRVVHKQNTTKKIDLHIRKIFSSIFLPSGYPATVSHDYLRYQIYNSLQAFCSALAGLIASRATLEGFGVGNASASATHALLLTILQDTFSRLTTIVAAYYIGTSLSPEAKTYRFLADILNDAAIILDTLSPLLDPVYIPFYIPWSFPGSASGLRVAALCMSGSLRALCGVAAGGSKSALTLHFATPENGVGDLGELNAKDASKETVLSLLGMLLGSLVVPHLTTQWSTYTVLFLLLVGHLAANYAGVRGVVLRSLNKQRAGIAWTSYRTDAFASGYRKHIALTLTPTEIASRERIFEWPGVLRNGCTDKIMGHCTVGSSFSDILTDHVDYKSLLRIFRSEKYLVCFDASSVPRNRPRSRRPRLHICLKEGHTPLDHLKAWVHAEEIGRAWTEQDKEEPTVIIEATYQIVDDQFTAFVKHLHKLGWNLDEGALMTGSPKTIFVSADEVVDMKFNQERKNI